MGVDKADEEYQDRCPCYNVSQEFRKVADLPGTGLVIYHHTPFVGDVHRHTQQCSMAGTPTPCVSQDVIILENTKDVKIRPQDLQPDLENLKITCPRCRHIYKRAQNLLQGVLSIDKNEVMGICNYCRIKLESEGPCYECKNMVKKFKLSKNKWATKMKNLSKDEILDTHSIIKEKNEDLFSDSNINDLFKKSIQISREPEIKQMFHSDMQLKDSTRINEELDLEKLEKAVSFIKPDAPIQESARQDLAPTVSYSSFFKNVQEIKTVSSDDLVKGTIFGKGYDDEAKHVISGIGKGPVYKKVVQHKDAILKFIPSKTKIKLDRSDDRAVPEHEKHKLDKKIPGLSGKSIVTSKTDKAMKRPKQEKLKPDSMLPRSSTEILDLKYVKSAKKAVPKQFSFYFPKTRLSELHVKEVSSSTLIKQVKNKIAEEKVVREAKAYIDALEGKDKSDEQYIDKQWRSKHKLLKADEEKIKSLTDELLKRLKKDPTDKQVLEQLKKIRLAQKQPKKDELTNKLLEEITDKMKQFKEEQPKEEPNLTKDISERHLPFSKTDDVFKTTKTLSQGKMTSKEKAKADLARKNIQTDMDPLKKLTGEYKTQKEYELKNKRFQNIDEMKAKETKDEQVKEAKTKMKDVTKSLRDQELVVSKTDQTGDRKIKEAKSKIVDESRKKTLENQELDKTKDKDIPSLIKQEPHEKRITKADKQMQTEIDQLTKLKQEYKKQKDVEIKNKHFQEIDGKLEKDAAGKISKEGKVKDKIEKHSKEEKPSEETPEKPVTVLKKGDTAMKAQEMTLPESQLPDKKEKNNLVDKKMQTEMEQMKKLQEQYKKQKEAEIKSKRIQEIEEKKARESADKKAGEEKIKKEKHEKTPKKEQDTKDSLVKQEADINRDEITAKGREKPSSPTEQQPPDKKEKVVDKKMLGEMEQFKKLKEEHMKQKEMELKNKRLQEMEEDKIRQAVDKKVKTDSDMDDVLKKLTEAKLDHNIGSESISKVSLIPIRMPETEDIIIGEKIFRHKPPQLVNKKEQELMPTLFKPIFNEEQSLPAAIPTVEIIRPAKDSEVPPGPQPCPSEKARKSVQIDLEPNKGIVRYSLSDRSFIDKGWTMLPTEKVVRKMNVYRMRPAHPEFDWFEHNKNKKLLTYDTDERLAEFDEKGRGRLYYRNGRLALDYYDAEEANAEQRFVIYSSGEPDNRGRTHPITILATFDYLGNGIVFDHAGKIRLKYNQTEGVILDRGIGPVSHWKWHTLNDPPVLQQVMIDTQMAHKDPQILKLGGPADTKTRPDNEEMLAIEFDNFIKEKSKKLSQKFKPFQIKMKALKINEHFSLKVLDQATIYLIFRDGSTNIKLNIGMVLDHQEIVDTDTAEVGEVSNSLEHFPARTESLAAMQRSVAYAQRYERARTERDQRLRRPEPMASVDELVAAASKPIRPPLVKAPTCSTSTTGYCRCKTPSSVYYNTRLI